MTALRARAAGMLVALVSLVVVGVTGAMVGCGEALPQGGGPADAGPQDQAAVAPPAGDCEGLDQAACEAAGAACMPLVLNLAEGTGPEGVLCFYPEGVPGVQAFAVCTASLDDRALTGDVVCGVDPATGQFFHFWSGSLVPAGWQRCEDVAEPC